MFRAFKTPIKKVFVKYILNMYRIIFNTKKQESNNFAGNSAGKHE